RSECMRRRGRSQRRSGPVFSKTFGEGRREATKSRAEKSNRKWPKGSNSCPLSRTRSSSAQFVVGRFGKELHALVEFPERQLDVDFRKGNNGIQSLIDLADETTFGAAEDDRGRLILLNQEIDAQGRDS